MALNKKLGRGKIIIAKPFMHDSLFEKSVVFLVDYHPTGTIGFILNQPLRINIHNLFSSFPESGAQVSFGGPVANETVHYLHTAGEIVDGAQEVLPGLFWGGDFNKLKFLMRNGVITDHQIRFYIGYSGWSPGQLEQEISQDQSWIISNADINYVFHRETPDKLWEKAMKHKGANFEIMADGAKQIKLN